MSDTSNSTVVYNNFTYIAHPHEKIEEASKSWFELGDFVGLDVIDDVKAEDIQQKEEENKEVLEKNN